MASLHIALVAVVVRAEPPAPTPVWNFDREAPGALPSEFSIGTLFDGRPAGEWQVLATDRAKSPPHVLAQVMAKGAEHAYKLVFVKNTVVSDLILQVSFPSIQGNADMGGSLIWRAADDRNYYLARANPLEQNIRLYRVVKGVRHLLHNFDQTIAVKHWHTLRVSHQGCRMTIFYDAGCAHRSRDCCCNSRHPFHLPSFVSLHLDRWTAH